MVIEAEVAPQQDPKWAPLAQLPQPDPTVTVYPGFGRSRPPLDDSRPTRRARPTDCDPPMGPQSAVDLRGLDPAKSAYEKI